MVPGRDAESGVRRFAVLTFGCRVNQADSFACEREFLAAGAETASADAADVVVVNTCSVTAAADQAARQAIRRIARANPRARIVVTGCYATRRPDELAGLPQVVRVLSNEAKDSGFWSNGVAGWNPAEFPSGEAAGVTPAGLDPPPGQCPRPGYRGRTVAFLRVQTGCDERCSYCSVPATRGASRSVPLAGVARDVERLEAAGYKEVTLTGVHLGAYGRDLQPASSLLTLLETLDRLPGAVSFRLSSLEPMDCGPSIVALVTGSARFAPHLHLPLQHASDRLLLAMRRPYSMAAYRELADTIRAAMPHSALGTDVVVGFPGESPADHQSLVRYLADSPITHLHVFPYSPRPGTEAERLRPRVPANVIRERCDEVRALGRELNRRFREAQVGRVRRALTIEDGSRAVTDNYLKVRIPRTGPRNERVLVRLTCAEPLLGEVVA